MRSDYSFFVVLLNCLAGIGTGEADTSAKSPPEEPLKIDIQRAILMAMDNNQSLFVEKMNPEITSTRETEEEAVFDPSVSGSLADSRVIADRLSRARLGKLGKFPLPIR